MTKICNWAFDLPSLGVVVKLFPPFCNKYSPGSSVPRNSTSQGPSPYGNLIDRTTVLETIRVG